MFENSGDAVPEFLYFLSFFATKKYKFKKSHAAWDTQFFVLYHVFQDIFR
jgi:hypothetical protein